NATRPMPQELRFALRSLLRSPGFLITAVGSLAIAIGASVAAFSVIDAVRLRALPFLNADRLVIIGETPAGPGTESAPACRGGCSVSYETYAQVLRTYPFRSVDAVAVTTSGGKSLTRNGEAILVTGGVVSPNAFDLLGVKPVIGRAFTAEDDQLGVPLTTVLSHQLWETQFGKDPGVIGTDVKLSDSHYTVIGVMPAGFRFEINSDFWLPVVPTLDPSTRPSIRTITVFARLAPGRTIADLRAELANVEPAVAAGAGRAQKTKLVADPLRERYASSTQSHDLIFGAIVACLLALACANLANLVLTRTLNRQREFAIRSALGAGAGRLARVLLVQNAVIVVAATVLGIGIAWSALGVLSSLPALTSLRPDGMEYRIDARVLGFATLVAVLAAALVSIIPARLVVGRDVHHLLRVSAAAGSSDRARWAQRLFVVGQVACATVLLIGAGLMARTVWHFAQVDLGFKVSRLVTGTPSFPHPWRVPEKYMPVTERILTELRELPGAASVGLRANNPLPRRDGRASITLEGSAEPLPAGLVPTAALSVSPDYFTAVGVPIISGRSFTDRDRKESIPVAIVNQWAARRWWPDREALGQTVRVDTGGGTLVITVVGVVANSKAARPNLLLDEDGPELYRPFEQAPSAFPSFFIAAASRPEALLRPVSMLLARLVPDRPVFSTLVSQTVTQQLGGVRTNAMQILAFAVLGLLLAVIGVYGVLSFEVSRRTREIGIRSALGASRATIAGNTLSDAARLTAIGVVAGVLVSVFATRLIGSLLYTTSPRDPLVYVGVVGCIALVSLVAAYLPARRAVKVDPIVALKAGDG
ncbi:MAG TPA: ADOP family duplicated permease, partial [Gemmatimonadaceae bacterium]|nr:ADOP family duplicated permease [Gemmatimonadaceae bacterium]